MPVAPDLAAAAHGILPLSAFLLAIGSFLTASLSAQEPGLGRPRLAMVFAWIALGVPLLATAAVALLGLNPALRSGVILSVLAPPVGSAAALATMLGLPPRLALLTSIALTVASPALMPLLAMLLRADVSLDSGHLAWRLIAIVGSAALIAAMARRWRARLTTVLPDALAAAGVAVIGLVIVGLAP